MGGAGGVTVELKKPTAIGDVDLSERYVGQQLLREPFSFSVSLAQLEGLSAAAYTADITDEAAIPIVLNFARDSRVQRYVCQFGYENANGTVVSARHEASGPNGMTVPDEVRWETGDRPPARVDIRYLIEWADPSWESADASLAAGTDVPCIIVNVSPGTRIAEITLVSDLASADSGSISAVNWSAELPSVDGRPAKTYTGSFFVDGAGPAGRLARELTSFPYPEGHEKDCIFRWVAEAALPDGTVLSGSGAFTLADTSEATIWLRELRSP